MDQCQVSIATSFDYDLPIETQIPLIAAAGFSHVSLGERLEHSGYPDPVRRRALATLLREHGLRLDTIHGPRVDRHEDGTLAAAVEAATELGAPVVVAHGGPFDFPPEELPTRLDALRRGCAAIAPLLAQTGVALALENVLPGPATDLVRRTLPELDPRFFGFCYDSAHDQIGGPRPFALLTELESRLRAVHLSDRVREFVDHVPPGDGFIDWPSLCQELRRTRFQAPLLLEVMVTHAAEKDPARLLRLAYERGCHLHDLVFGEDSIDG